SLAGRLPDIVLVRMSEQAAAPPEPVCGEFWCRPISPVPSRRRSDERPLASTQSVRVRDLGEQRIGGAEPEDLVQRRDLRAPRTEEEPDHVWRTARLPESETHAVSAGTKRDREPVSFPPPDRSPAPLI